MATPISVARRCEDNCGTLCNANQSCYEYKDPQGPKGYRCQCFSNSAPPLSPWVKQRDVMAEMSTDEIYKTHLLQARMAFGGTEVPNLPIEFNPRRTLSDFCKCGGEVGCVTKCPDKPQCWWMNPNYPGPRTPTDVNKPPDGGVFQCHEDKGDNYTPRYFPNRAPLDAARNAANFI